MKLTVWTYEGRREQVLPEHHLFPDRPGHHDRVEQRHLEQNRRGRQRIALPRGQVAQHQNRRDKASQQLNRRQDTLHHRPACLIAARALGLRIQRLAVSR